MKRNRILFTLVMAACAISMVAAAHLVEVDATEDVNVVASEESPPTKLAVVWTSGDPDVAHKMTFMYVHTLPCCTIPIEAECLFGLGFHHPIISLQGIPSSVIVFRILHPILASTLGDTNPLARIARA